MYSWKFLQILRVYPKNTIKSTINEALFYLSSLQATIFQRVIVGSVGIDWL